MKQDQIKVDFNQVKLMEEKNFKITIKNVEKDRVVIIYNCQNSSIYIKGTPEFLVVKKSKNCEIFVEGVKNLVLIENCNEITYCGISKIINIYNVNDSKINSFSLYRPNLLGEIKKVELGSHNANYQNIF